MTQPAATPDADRDFDWPRDRSTASLLACGRSDSGADARAPSPPLSKLTDRLNPPPEAIVQTLS